MNGNMNGNGVFPGGPADTSAFLDSVLRGSNCELRKRREWHMQQANIHFICACRITLLMFRNTLIKVGCGALVGCVLINSFGNMIDDKKEFDSEKPSNSEKPSTSMYGQENKHEETIPYEVADTDRSRSK